jgi:hypothetical protein
MAGTGDNLIAAADQRAKDAQKAYEKASSAQAGPGHEARLKDAERARDAAAAEAASTRSRWG